MKGKNQPLYRRGRRDLPAPEAAGAAESVTQTPLRAIHEANIPRLTRLFWLGLAVLAGVYIFLGAGLPWGPFVHALALVVLTLLPGFLWCRGFCPGLPLYPVFAGTFLWSFASPLLLGHPTVLALPEELQVGVCQAVVVGLLFGLLGWVVAGQSRPAPPTEMWVFRPGGRNWLFWAALVGVIVFNLNGQAGWVYLPNTVQGLVRAALYALNTFAIFVLAYRLARSELRPPEKAALVLLFVANIVVSSAGLLLVNAMSMSLVFFLGYVSGGARIPWFLVVFVMLWFPVLHEGKHDMRGKYWTADAPGGRLTPDRYPSWYGEWFDYSWDAIQQDEEEGLGESSIVYRGSLFQILAHIRAMSPRHLDYLGGETYALVPAMLVPRFINPDKPVSHATTYKLAVYYGIQTEEQTEYTTVGFGMFNEAFANFGWTGAAGFGLIFGLVFGWMGRWSSRGPLLSFRVLYSITVLFLTIQTEYSSGVFSTVLFQSSVIFLGVTFFFKARILPQEPGPGMGIGPGPGVAPASDIKKKYYHLTSPRR